MVNGCHNDGLVTATDGRLVPAAETFPTAPNGGVKVYFRLTAPSPQRAGNRRPCRSLARRGPNFSRQPACAPTPRVYLGADLRRWRHLVLSDCLNNIVELDINGAAFIEQPVKHSLAIPRADPKREHLPGPVRIADLEQSLFAGGAQNALS